MKYNALAIKNWIISAVSPMGWSVLISRALPELLEVNPHFSASYVGKNTRWDETEVYVIQWYLRKMYGMEIPEEILWQNGHLKADYFEMLSFDFFKNTRTAFNFKKTLLSIFKI